MNQLQIELQRNLYRLLLNVSKVKRGFDAVLSTALGLVVAITNARLGYIEVRDSNGKQWWSTYHCSDNEMKTIQQQISSGIISEVIETGETIVTPSAFLDPSLQIKDSVREERIESVLCSPFKHGGNVGVIYLQGDGDSDFGDNHCMMETELFTRHITPLLQRLYNQIEGEKNEVKLNEKYDLTGIVGKSPLFTSRIKEAMAIAELDVTVLITGKTGSGKSILAKLIHKNSHRRNKSFVHLNCANLPEHLAESELFGAARGAHSGAYTDIKGKIAAAKGGTLFLDEIGELPLNIQPKLLQFLEEGSYYPLGASVPSIADVRIIAASNIDFKKAISNGTFREDLYYRLCVFPIEMPSLNQRQEDIPELTTYFVEKHCRRFNFPIFDVSSSVMLKLQDLEWNGNIRQLENIIQHSILRARNSNSKTILLNHVLDNERQTTRDEMVTYRKCKDDWERRFINLNLKKCEWNVTETAKLLELSRSHLNNLIKQHNLERKDSVEQNVNV